MTTSNKTNANNGTGAVEPCGRGGPNDDTEALGAPSAATTRTTTSSTNNNNNYGAVHHHHDDNNIMEDSANYLSSSSLTIDNAIEKLGNGPFQRRILWAAGLCFAADSMEVLLLSFLGVVLQQQWGLTEGETSFMTSSVFVGAMLGTLVLGPAADYLGRKPMFTLTAALITVFGIATAATNDFPSLLFCRFMVGFGVGGLTVPFDALAEFSSNDARGSQLLTLDYFWTSGTLLVPVAAYVSLGGGGAGNHHYRHDDDDNDDGWRVFVILCAIPCLISTVLGLIVVPESPRFLLCRGRHDRALEVLRDAAVVNGKDPDKLFPRGIRLVDEHHAKEQQREAGVRDLLSPPWRRTTILLWLTWGAFAFTYYGAVLVITLVFSSESESSGSTSAATSAGGGGGGGGYSFDYAAIVAAGSAEILGTVMVISLVDRVGRIPTQAVSYVVGGVMVFALCILTAASENGTGTTNSIGSRSSFLRIAMFLGAFFTRMFFMGASCTTWISTAEILTTEVRTTGHSAANAIARMGGALSPFLVTSSRSYATTGTVMLLVSLLAAICSYQLPETLGRDMGSVFDNDKAQNKSTKQFHDPEAAPMLL